MLTTESSAEQLARQGWSSRTFHHTLNDGGAGWAMEANKGSSRVLAYADTAERAAFLIADLVLPKPQPNDWPPVR